MGARRLAAVVALWLLASGPVAHALDPQRPLREFGLDVWTTRDGLPHNMIQAIAQTPDGYLWFGTWEGLVRFNGREFRVYDRMRVPELPDNGVRAIAVAGDGSLWLGTSRGGVVRFDGSTWDVLDHADGLPSDEIMDVLEDARGRLWIATESHGVAVREPDGRVRVLREADGLPDDTTTCLASDRSGGIWIGTASGAVRLTDAGMQRVGADEGMPPGAILTIYVDSRNRVWFGSESGPYRLDDGRAVAAASGSHARGYVPRILEDRAGNLWVGTVNSGLVRLGEHGDEALALADGLPHGRVSGLLEDREGSLWIGTNGGLARLKDAPFTSFTTTSGLPDDYVRAVLEDRDGRLWFGTSRGLAWTKDGQWGVLRGSDGLAGDSVLSLLATRSGDLWVGTYESGLTVWRDGRAQRAIGLRDGLPGSQVRAMAEAADGAIWVGTARGLARIAGTAIRSFTMADGLPRNFILSLHADQFGRVWVGTANGLAVIEGERVSAVDDPVLAPVQDVFGFHDDGRGSLWMATDRGLVRFRDGKYARLSTDRGLPFETIFHLVEDGEGNAWITSNRGIFRVARAALDAALDGELARVDGHVFGEADGMASAQCNGGSQPTAWRSHDGTLWFATARGVASVRPDALRVGSQSPPPVVVEEIRVDDVERAAASSLELAPGAQKVEFRFAGLTYLVPERVRYRYRLEGFEERWITTDRLHSAQYTNLDPGAYRFRVTAAHADGEWNPREAQVAMYVAPLLWQTLWFQVLALLAAVLLVFFAYRLRVLQLRAREAELSRMVDARTRDLEAQRQRLLDADREKSQLLSQVREQADASERQAREDALTGLPNRRQFDALFATEFERCRRAGLPITAVLLDADYFKRINDRFSHAAGDEVLRVVARLLAEACVGRGIASRYGGEEFAMAFPGMPVLAAAGVCEDLRLAIESHDFSGIHAEMRVTVSAGLSDRADALNHERLLAFADTKLYEAKHAGRNRVVW